LYIVDSGKRQIIQNNYTAAGLKEANSTIGITKPLYSSLDSLQQVFTVACGKQRLYWGNEADGKSIGSIVSAEYGGDVNSTRLVTNILDSVKDLIFKGETLFILSGSTAVYKATHGSTNLTLISD